MFLAFSHMAVGCIWLLAWVPRRTIGVNFYRLMTVVAVALLFFAVLARYPAQDFQGLLLRGSAVTEPGPSALEFWTVLGCLVTASAFMVSVVFGKRELVARVCGILAGATGAAAVVVTAYGMRTLLARPVLAPVLAFTFILSALANGAVVVGMNLGHWYLMARLPLQPLQRISTVLLGALAVQAGCTVLLYAVGQQPDLREPLLQGLKLETMDGLYVWIRLLVGLLFPLLLAYMIRDTARSGSTMSATGLLYIALLSVFAGEAASRFLLISTGFWL